MNIEKETTEKVKHEMLYSEYTFKNKNAFLLKI